VTTKARGMGIGLSICRTITDGHGGRIWASDHLGEGTAFHFTLPLAESHAP
jgi:signal transduction histidine kinase